VSGAFFIQEAAMAEISSLFVTRLYRAKLNELAKKKVDYAELRAECEAIAEDDEAGSAGARRTAIPAIPPIPR
jgi:hypothetical protein